VANFSTDPSAVLFASGNTAIGDFYGGTIRTINANGGYRIGYDFTFTGSYVRNWIRLPEGNFNTDLLGGPTGHFVEELFSVIHSIQQFDQPGGP
jgi:hypothetical protein